MYECWEIPVMMTSHDDSRIQDIHIYVYMCTQEIHVYVYYTATHCDTLQQTAGHRITPKHTATW